MLHLKLVEFSLPSCWHQISIRETANAFSVQIIINGLISGSAIALLAVGFQTVYLPTRVFFVALAGIYTLAPYLVLSTRAAGVPWPLTLGLVSAAGCAIAMLCDRLNHAILARRCASEGAHLISSLGIYIAIVQVVVMIWGNSTHTLHQELDAASHWGGVILSGAQWITCGVATGILGAFLLLLRSSDLGLRLRALADNPTIFALFGYDVDRHRLLAFALAGFFATAAGLVTAYDIGFGPQLGLQALLLAIVAVIVGGRQSFAGPVVGALLIGVLRAQVVWYTSARWEEAATFGLLGIFLLMRPQGIFGDKGRSEEDL